MGVCLIIIILFGGHVLDVLAAPNMPTDMLSACVIYVALKSVCLLFSGVHS